MKLFILGSTGDLVRRKVLPALQQLDMPLEIYALGRKSYTHELYADFVCTDYCTPDFRSVMRYVQIDFEKQSILDACLPHLSKKETNFFYVSLPPDTFDAMFAQLSAIQKDGYKLSILVEKPFGKDAAHAKTLHTLLRKHNLDVIISDHYLFKKNILSLHRQNFSKMKLVSLESIGLEGRKYYDTVGALHDMVQSHFLNIAFKFFDDFSDFKIIKYERKQYDSYVSELGKRSDTETFVDIILESHGKEFEFITGKGFAKKESYLEIDGRHIELDDSENPYVEIFKRFFTGNHAGFPSIEHAFLAWKIIDAITKKKTAVGTYKKGITYRQAQHP